MTLDEINALSDFLARYRPSAREKQIGRTAAYYERLGEGKIPCREGRARANQGQVPMALKGGELVEVGEYGVE